MNTTSLIKSAFLSELEKIAVTRSVKEWRRASGAGDAGAADQIARASGQLGLSPRYLEDISTGGAEAGVDKMMGRVQGPAGDVNESGLLARKLYKPDSAISRQEFTGPLLQQKQQITDAARAMSPEAKNMVPAMYGHKEMPYLGGQLRHQSFHEFVPGIGDIRGTNLGNEDRPIYSRGTVFSKDLDSVEKKVLEPMRSKGLHMADTITRHEEGGRGINYGNVVHSPQGPKVLDFLPGIQGQENPAISSFKKYRPGDSKFEGAGASLRDLRKEVFNPSMKIEAPKDLPKNMPPIPRAAAAAAPKTMNALGEAASRTAPSSPQGRALANVAMKTAPSSPMARAAKSVLSGSAVESVPPGLLTRFQNAAKGVLGHLHV